MSVPRWFYRFRSYLVCPPLFFALFSHYYEIESHSITWPLGAGIIFVGIALRIWAQQHLHHRLRVHKQLTTTGPYQFVRNPLYVGNIIICLGASIILKLLWLIPITIFWCIGTYSVVIRYEEDYLLEKYGNAYRRYLLGVPRWVPKISSLENVGLTGQYLFQAVLVELPCLLVFLPCVIKEFIEI